MTSSTAKILKEASRLPAQEKLELVNQLLEELDIPDPAIEALWADEAQRRSNAVKQGHLGVKPLTEAVRKHGA